MNNDLLEFLTSFHTKLETLFPDELYANDLVKAVTNGNLSMISTNSEISLDHYENLVEEVESRMKQLHTINKNPRRFLRSEELVRPVELSKNINNRTIYELSKSSHNWKRKRIASVEPTHLLTEINEDDIKLYENKVYKTVLDRSHRILTLFDHEIQKMINDKRSAVQIGKGSVSGYKSAKLFRKIAPNNIDDLNKLDEEILQLSAIMVEETKRKVQLLQRGKLYYSLRKEKPIRSPLNKTNILMKDKNYFSVWELWKHLDKEDYRRSEITKENESKFDSPGKIYITYVFVTLVVVLLNDGYKIVENSLGDFRSNNLCFIAEDDYTQIKFIVKDDDIIGSMSETGIIKIEIENENQFDFFKQLNIQDDGLQIESNYLILDKRIKSETINRLPDEYGDFLKQKYAAELRDKGKGKARSEISKEKVLMNNDVIKVAKKFKKKSKTIDFNINVLQHELPGTNMELEEAILNLQSEHRKTFDLIVYPGIDSVEGIKMSDFNTYLSNTLGENLTIRLGKNIVSKFGNYKFQMFKITPNNLSSINRISRFFNIMKFRFENYKKSLEEYCPSCGKHSVNKKDDNNYTCYHCKSIWSYSRCSKCNNEYLYLRLEDENYIARDQFRDLQSYLDYLEIYRGTLALTNIDITNSKTLCSKCGHS